MKQMKHIKFVWALLLAVPILVGSTGCKKFLDRKPLTATLEDLDQGGLEGQIYGLYGGIRNPDIAGEGFSGIPWLAMHGFRSDDAMKGSSDADGADWANIYDNFQYVKDHWSSNTYYDQHYRLIDLANVALKTADSLRLNDPASLVNIGEAKFFRAFAYFDLVRTYGQVRLITAPVTSAAQVNAMPKSNEAAIYAQIDADLNAAEAVLPPNWGNRFPGRLTTYAAKTLHAKTYLYRQQWAAALSLAQQVIQSGQYQLESNFSNIWKEAGENGPESIFEIQAEIGPGGTNPLGSRIGITQGIRGVDVWDLGWGWNTPTETLVNSGFETGDPRRPKTILFSGQSDDPANGGYGRTLPPYPTLPRHYWSKKYYADPAKQASTGERQAAWMNHRILRLSDVYLMAAEAANELGGTANQALAVQYLEAVRARARGGNSAVLPPVAFVSQAQMRTAIQQERRAEFAMEGERFFDLVRWGIAPAALGGQGFQPRHKYYPLPQPVIDASNGALVQNPDYP
ncbi:RagB/SusD family nutrient uptake outer membrane protein [Flaviaesturariibacter amylovorans]|uniref:RagB/SusD family nutrient uptake outer membrane protein n=2 Tax=Flaviaesturariibacter amylovorans TaxID=1084520 RepID=A0ABP8H0B7_9BACT